MISFDSPHVLRANMGCTCGGANEIGLTAMGVKLNGSRRLPSAEMWIPRSAYLRIGQSHRVTPAGSQHSCQPTVTLHVLPLL